MSDLDCELDEILKDITPVHLGCKRKPTKMTRYFDRVMGRYSISCCCEFKENGGGFCLCRTSEEEYLKIPKQLSIEYSENMK